RPACLTDSFYQGRVQETRRSRSIDSGCCPEPAPVRPTSRGGWVAGRDVGERLRGLDRPGRLAALGVSGPGRPSRCERRHPQSFERMEIDVIRAFLLVAILVLAMLLPYPPGRFDASAATLSFL